METQTLPSFPAGENPFHHDLTRMGTPVGDNVMIMYEHHNVNRYIIVCDKTTGERLKITL